MRCVVAALASFVVAFGTVEAHPGGTDRFGCHTQSSTGQRHCHGGSDGEGAPPALAAQAGAELGSSWRSRDGEEVTYFASFYTQTDGSMLFLANLGGHLPKTRGVVCYADLGVGIVWLGRTEMFPMFQFGICAKIPFTYLNDADRAPYLKLGAFAALIADGNEAETIGLSAALGFTF
jgi:hypothetical protein